MHPGSKMNYWPSNCCNPAYFWPAEWSNLSAIGWWQVLTGTSFFHTVLLFFLFLCDSPEEAGRYLETYKSYEKKPADLLKEHVEKDYLSKVKRWTGICTKAFLRDDVWALLPTTKLHVFIQVTLSLSLCSRQIRSEVKQKHLLWEKPSVQISVEFEADWNSSVDWSYHF